MQEQLITLGTAFIWGVGFTMGMRIMCWLMRWVPARTDVFVSVDRPDAAPVKAVPIKEVTGR